MIPALHENAAREVLRTMDRIWADEARRERAGEETGARLICEEREARCWLILREALQRIVGSS